MVSTTVAFGTAAIIRCFARCIRNRRMRRFTSGSPSVSRCSSFSSCRLIRNPRACRTRSHTTSSVTIAACTASIATITRSTCRNTRSASVAGSQNIACGKSGNAPASTCHPAHPTTPIFSSDFPASSSTDTLSTRFSPRAGDSRARSGINAAGLNKNPVCPNAAATPASIAANTNGAAARPKAPNANQIAATGSNRSGRASNTASRPANPCAIPGAKNDNTNAAAANTNNGATSRETGTFPSSRACCIRRADAASVRSSWSGMGWG